MNDAVNRVCYHIVIPSIDKTIFHCMIVIQGQIYRFILHICIKKYRRIYVETVICDYIRMDDTYCPIYLNNSGYERTVTDRYFGTY